MLKRNSCMQRFQRTQAGNPFGTRLPTPLPRPTDAGKPRELASPGDQFLASLQSFPALVAPKRFARRSGNGRFPSPGAPKSTPQPATPFQVFLHRPSLPELLPKRLPSCWLSPAVRL